MNQILNDVLEICKQIICVKELGKIEQEGFIGPKTFI